MFELISDVIQYTGSANIDDSLVSVCAVLILVFFVVIIDMVYRVFANFWR